jgi:hypothetical protein
MKQTYKQYLEERFTRKTYHYHAQDTYRLVAVSGDVSARGMGNKARIINVHKDDFDRVNYYLEVEAERNELMHSVGFKKFCFGPLSKKDQEAKDYLWDLISQAIDNVRDIFTSKYDFRSTWAWIEMPEFDHDAYEIDNETTEEVVA